MVTSASLPKTAAPGPGGERHECPVDAVLRLLMGPWTTYILYVLRTQGPRRFGELKREVGGISAKVLTERLRMLEEARLVHRDYQATIPPQVTYSLASRGAELNPMLDALKDIALRWQSEDAQAVSQQAMASIRQAAE
ncbi:MAG: helix-turn-helix transcriptional regulator [Ferrovibrio sp.]|uniref:winged helix-turn-helix transcriptional regulator n=1 Tax=Ferrovibrio sp. TaxID=1917215 RepID=UPI00260BF6A5|nr:helix-turn-helix domain-containing protein [Ferrovibrio sp.]MCW0235482.1 helix-turn-helix transcriptional regulator [Ferrovibrio sp.]